MKTAFMFPGQGAQFVGMGEDFYKKYEEAKQVYEKASKILNKNIAQMCFNSTIEELSKTINTQLAISVTSLAILAVLKKYKIEANVEVGLSLGEYVALIDSKIINFEEGLKLLERRSYYMANKLPNEQYSMIAVIGLEVNKIEEISAQMQNEGFVVPANYNYSNQTVLTCEEKIVDEVTNKLKQAGAKKVVKLKTSGPFHTKKLLEASKCYKESLENATFEIIENKVIKNIDGSFYTKKDNIKEILANHIISPVRFDKTIKTMQNEGIDTYIEIGPRKSFIWICKKRK